MSTADTILSVCSWDDYLGGGEFVARNGANNVGLQGTSDVRSQLPGQAAVSEVSVCGAGRGRVSLFFFNLDLLPEKFSSIQDQILDRGELERRDRLRFPELRRRFSAAHVGMRVLLARYLRSEDICKSGSWGGELIRWAGRLVFARGDWGKPYLAGFRTEAQERRAGRYLSGGRANSLATSACNVARAEVASAGDTGAHGQDWIAFNLTHSEGWAALAVTAGRVSSQNFWFTEPNSGWGWEKGKLIESCGSYKTDWLPEVGLDLEVSSLKDRAGVAERFFTPKECEYISGNGCTAKLGVASEECAERFSWVWTRKEACLKLWGTGLKGIPLNSFEVLDGLPHPASAMTEQPEVLSRVEKFTALCRSLYSWRLSLGLQLSLALNFVPYQIEIVRLHG